MDGPTEKGAWQNYEIILEESERNGVCAVKTEIMNQVYKIKIDGKSVKCRRLKWDEARALGDIYYDGNPWNPSQQPYQKREALMCYRPLYNGEQVSPETVMQNYRK